MNIDLKDIDEFTSHFVKPMVEAVRLEVQASITPMVKEVSDLKGRVNTLEKDQKRALVGYGVFSAALAAVMAYGKSKIMGYFTKS